MSSVCIICLLNKSKSNYYSTDFDNACNILSKQINYTNVLRVASKQRKYHFSPSISSINYRNYLCWWNEYSFRIRWWSRQFLACLLRKWIFTRCLLVFIGEMLLCRTLLWLRGNRLNTIFDRRTVEIYFSKPLFHHVNGFLYISYTYWVTSFWNQFCTGKDPFRVLLFFDFFSSSF